MLTRNALGGLVCQLKMSKCNKRKYASCKSAKTIVRSESYRLVLSMHLARGSLRCVLVLTVHDSAALVACDETELLLGTLDASRTCLPAVL